MLEGFHHTFHGFIQAERPTRWESAIVFARLVESAKIIAHTTSRSRQGFGSGWPEVMQEYSDHLGRGSEARAEVWARWALSKPQYDAKAIARANEAGYWPIVYLKGREDLSRIVLAYAACSAAGHRIGPILKRNSWASSTARKKKMEALVVISDCLNRDRVPVIEAIAP